MVAKAGKAQRRSKSQSRMQRVEGILQVAHDADASKGQNASKENTSSSLFSVHACSDRMAGDQSSNLMNPKWKRLVHAVAHTLAQRCGESISGFDADTTRLLTYFVSSDAGGGGSQMDIKQCLSGSLEVMDLSDKSIGLVLLGAFHFLQADDTKLTSQTWRLLVVTSLLVATDILCTNAERDQATMKLRMAVAHWWSPVQADRAIQVFKQRDSFKKEPLDRHKIASLYFDLRQHAMELGDNRDGDDSSNGAVFEFSQEIAQKVLLVGKKPSTASETDRSNSGSRGSHRRPADRSGASLALSDDDSSLMNEGGEHVLSI
jgi:hypothetical protein